MTRFARSLWKRIYLRGVGYADRHTDLEQLYRLRDPWEMESEREQFRFEKTNAFLESHLGHLGSLLEIGCGEGHQSVFLNQICDRLIGIDVSQRAVQRASDRCPESLFLHGDIFSSQELRSEAPFDLVTACEVLYYMTDVAAAMDQMFALASTVLVSFYGKQADRLEPVLDSYEGAETSTFEFEGTIWHLRLWRPR